MYDAGSMICLSVMYIIVAPYAIYDILILCWRCPCSYDVSCGIEFLLRIIFINTISFMLMISCVSLVTANLNQYLFFNCSLFGFLWYDVYR